MKWVPRGPGEEAVEKRRRKKRKKKKKMELRRVILFFLDFFMESFCGGEGEFYSTTFFPFSVVVAGFC